MHDGRDGEISNLGTGSQVSGAGAASSANQTLQRQAMQDDETREGFIRLGGVMGGIKWPVQGPCARTGGEI